jgi:hypothetical protein
MSKIHVNITGGAADPDPARVSIKNNDEVVWHSKDGKESKVKFQNGASPFDKNEFPVPPSGDVPSGQAKSGALPPGQDEKPYKYDVIGSNGTNDPTIIIQK